MDLEKIVKGVGIIAGAFNPVVGNGIVALSSVAGALDGVDDKDLEDVKGLSYVSKSLQDMLNSKNFNVDKVKELIEILNSISLILDKNLKLIK